MILIPISSLKKGETYQWNEGADRELKVEYIGTAEENQNIKPGSALGRGYIFKFIDKTGPFEYVELSRKAIYQGAISPIESQFEIGREIEREHVDTIEKIKREKNISTDDAIDMIVRDHLIEDPNYYTKLKAAKLKNGSKIYDFKQNDWVEVVNDEDENGNYKLHGRITGVIDDNIHNVNYVVKFPAIDNKEFTYIASGLMKIAERGSKIKQYVNGKKIFKPENTFKNKKEWENEIENMYADIVSAGPDVNDIESFKFKKAHVVYVQQPNSDLITASVLKQKVGYWDKSLNEGYIYDEPKFKRGVKINFSEIAKQDLRADYPRKDAQWVWDNWAENQRYHFLYDHSNSFVELLEEQTINELKILPYNKLSNDIKNELKNHIKFGRYEHGKKIKPYDEHQRDLIKQNIQSDYPITNPETLWDNWTEEQRYHFLTDHDKKMSLEIANDLKQEPFKNLTKQIKQLVYNHIIGGRYEHGKKIEIEKNYQSNIKEFEKQTKIKDVIIGTYGTNITPFYGDADTYNPPILITKSELLSIAIESFKQAHPTMDEQRLKGEINDWINYLFNEK